MPEPSGAPPTGQRPQPSANPPEEAGKHQDPPAEDTETGSPVSPPPTNLQRLREQYAEAAEDRTTTIPIAPGRFNGNLAARYRTIPWTDTRKRAKRANRGGLSEEAELNFAAQQLAAACETILIRLDDAGDPVPLNEVPGTGFGSDPVRYDARLCQALGIDPVPPSAAGICRVVFRNPHALNDHYAAFEQFVKEASDDVDDDEDGEGGALEDRPT